MNIEAAQEIPKSRGLETKKRILDAATKRFAELGYKSTSVRKIAGDVGIRESALYNHFENKDAIFNAVMHQSFNVKLTDYLRKYPLETSAHKGRTFLVEFAALFKLLSFDAKSQTLFKILLNEMMHSAAIRELFDAMFFKEIHNDLSQIFFMMMQEGMIRSADPMVMTQEFLAPLFFLRLQITLKRLDGQNDKFLHVQFEKHAEFFWEGIRID